MKKILALFTFVSSFCFSNLNHETYASNRVQINPMWFSEDFNTFFIKVVLVPEEDSPFHYGFWGNERGTHIYQVDFSNHNKEFKHSPTCNCSGYFKDS